MISGLYKYIVFDPIESSPAGLRRALPPHHGHRRRAAQHRLGRREPLVRAALLPPARGSAAHERIRAGHRRRRASSAPTWSTGCSPPATSRASSTSALAVPLAARGRDLHRRHHRPRRPRRRCATATRSSTSPRSPTSATSSPTPPGRGGQHARHPQRARGRARAKVGRVVYGSTTWVYSDSEQSGRRGDAAPGAAPPLHGDQARRRDLLRAYAELYDLESHVLRFGIPYGPRARAGRRRRQVHRPRLRRQGADDRRRRQQTRRFIYVEDLADGIVAALAPRRPTAPTTSPATRT